MTPPRAGRFSARPGGGAYSRTSPPYHVIDRLLTHFIRLSSGPDGRERIVENADGVLATLRRGADVGCWPGVLELARTAEPAFALSTRWGAWEAVLEFALGASRALGDRSGEGWALHQLGVRAMALGDEESARSLFSQALAVRSEVGPPEAEDRTASLLRQLNGDSAQ
jgi:hypothetical protein